MDGSRPCGVLCRIDAALAEVSAEARGGAPLRPVDVARRAKAPCRWRGLQGAGGEGVHGVCVKTARGLTYAVPQGPPLRTASREEIYGILEAL